MRHVSKSAVMDSEASLREKPPFVVAAISLFILLAMCSALVPYVLLALNHQFLPSPKYLVEVKYVSLISGLVCGLPAAFLCMSEAPNADNNSAKPKIFVPVFALFMFFIVGHQLVTNIAPILAAVHSQEDVDIIYIVDRVDPFNSKSCNAPIILDYMPWYNDKLCNFPPELTDSLSHGTQIVVTGRGTSWGLFVESARVVPPAVLP